MRESESEREDGDSGVDYLTKSTVQTYSSLYLQERERESLARDFENSKTADLADNAIPQCNVSTELVIGGIGANLLNSIGRGILHKQLQSTR